VQYLIPKSFAVLSGKGFTGVYRLVNLEIQVVKFLLWLLALGFGKVVQCIEKYYRHRRRWLKVAVENIGNPDVIDVKGAGLHQSSGDMLNTPCQISSDGQVSNLWFSSSKLNLAVWIGDSVESSCQLLC